MADTGVPLQPVGSPTQWADAETNAGRSNWQMQRVKIVLGAIDTDNGDLAAGNPMPVSWTGQRVAATQSGAWSVSLAAALPAGANVIGGVTQSGGPWSVSWSGQSVSI